MIPRGIGCMFLFICGAVVAVIIAGGFLYGLTR